MRVFQAYILLAFAHLRLVPAQYGGGGYGGGSDNDAPSTSTTTAPNGSPSSSPQTGDILFGDSRCLSVMCINATVDTAAGTVQYELQSTTESEPGWMAIGFGNGMLNNPMVIMWVAPDNSVVLSQRRATSYTPPQPDPNPPRAAQLLTSLSSTGVGARYTFTVPHNGVTTQPVMWAYGTERPNGGADATLQIHLDKGVLSLNLAQPLDTNGNPPPPVEATPTPNYQRLIVVHGIVCALAFLLLLPTGALLARLFRTTGIQWFKGHWIIQWPLSGCAIIVGFALGIQSVVEHRVSHLDTTHKQLGVAIFVLYVVQCCLGGFIHFVKDPNRKQRPPQNYGHAVLGLLIIGLAIWQVYTGFVVEYPRATGRGSLGNGVRILWIVWATLLPVLYFGGLSLLPRQFKQEKAASAPKGPKQEL